MDMENFWDWLVNNVLLACGQAKIGGRLIWCDPLPSWIVLVTRAARRHGLG